MLLALDSFLVCVCWFLGPFLYNISLPGAVYFVIIKFPMDILDLFIYMYPYIMITLMLFTMFFMLYETSFCILFCFRRHHFWPFVFGQTRTFFCVTISICATINHMHD